MNTIKNIAVYARLALGLATICHLNSPVQAQTVQDAIDYLPAAVQGRGGDALGINRQSNIRLYYGSVTNKVDLLPFGNQQADYRALIAAVTYAATERLNVDASLPYAVQNDVTTTALGTTAVSRPGWGDLSLGARYALMPEANGFALVGRLGVTATNGATQDLAPYIELQPLWRLGSGTVVRTAAGLGYSKTTANRQYLSAGLLWPVTEALWLGPTLRYTNYEARNGFSGYNATAVGVAAGYTLNADWRLTASLTGTRITSPTLFSTTLQGTQQQVDFLVGVVRGF